MKTIAQQVAERIRSEILSGALAPGTRLLQDDEAGRLGVSRTPIREAFRELEAERLVEVVPNRGAVVARISLAELREIYLIREMLEPPAAMYAAERASVSDLEEIERLLRQLRNVPLDDTRRLLELNKSFHMQIYRSARMPNLLEVIVSLWGRVEVARAAYVSAPLRARRAEKEHAELYKAVRDGNRRAAAELTRSHLAETADALLKKVEEGREDGQRRKKHGTSSS